MAVKNGSVFLLLGLCWLLGGSWKFVETEEHAAKAAMLRQALTRSQKVEYSATIKGQVFPEFIWLKETRVFRRLGMDGKPMLRLELYDADGLRCHFLCNQDGQFAVCHRPEVVACGGDFLRLFAFESLFQAPNEMELEKCDYAVQEAQAKGRQVRRIRMSLPAELKKEQESGYLWGLTGAQLKTREELFLKYPFVREFEIDEASGAIVSRREFNGKGQLLWKLELGEVRFSPDWDGLEDLFATPSKIDCRVLTTKTFRQMVNSLGATSLASGSRRGALSSGWRWSPAVVKYLLLAAGILLVGGAWWLRRRTGE